MRKYAALVSCFSSQI